jgi:hypothetical protein
MYFYIQVIIETLNSDDSMETWRTFRFASGFETSKKSGLPVFSGMILRLLGLK